MKRIDKFAISYGRGNENELYNIFKK